MGRQGRVPKVCAWLAISLASAPLLAGGGVVAADVMVAPYAAPAGCEMMQAWYDDLVATQPEGTVVPLKLDPTDAQIAQLGLPSRAVLQGQRFPEPTLLLADGTRVPVDAARLALGGDLALATYAGTGCLGIRPGALLLIIDQEGLAICSMAHVYGAPGNYQISTAGHCATKVGETMTVVAAVGNHQGLAGPVLLDFGATAKTTGDGGPGRDWALLSIRPEFQDLVTPTMCFWAGPHGRYTAQGEVVDVNVPRRLNGLPTVTLNPDAGLVQDVVHYGHGLGLGAGGTPRSGAGIVWASTYFAFVGTIAPGDSGSGANTATGQAAGIITHIGVDPWLRYGTGVALGTRVTQVQATLADGQLVAYPVPAPALP